MSTPDASPNLGRSTSRAKPLSPAASHAVATGQNAPALDQTSPRKASVPRRSLVLPRINAMAAMQGLLTSKTEKSPVLATRSKSVKQQQSVHRAAMQSQTPRDTGMQEDNSGEGDHAGSETQTAGSATETATTRSSSVANSEVGASDSAHYAKQKEGWDTNAQQGHTLEHTSFPDVPFLPARDIVFGDYLAKGSFGLVYRGQWGTQTVALKQVNLVQAQQTLDLSGDEVLEALQWEVRRMNTLRHPNLVQFHGLCVKENQTYLVMEFCGGGSLQSLLQKEDIAPARLWQWMLEITQAMAYLHSQGVLHRDLKAENILIDQHGRARLADLGVAQVDDLLEPTEPAIVAKGYQDRDFAAPENVSGGEGSNLLSSKATDIYALGLVFWQMASRGAKPGSWKELHQQDPGLSAAKAGRRMPIASECPPAIKELILSCWRWIVEDRTTLANLLQSLQRIGVELYPDHAQFTLCKHLEQTLYQTREERRQHVPILVTAKALEVSGDRYWQEWDRPVISTTPGNSAVTTTTTTAAPTTITTTTSTTSGSSSSLTTTTSAGTAAAAGGTSGSAPGSIATSAIALNPPVLFQDLFNDFLAESGSRTLLLLGEAGVGKSHGIQVQAQRILAQWRAFFTDPKGKPRPKYLPVFIREHVSAWTQAQLKDAVPNLVKKYGLDPDKTRLLVFVDGYDECRMGKQAFANLAKHLGLRKGAKLVVTCRPGVFSEDQWEQCFGFRGGFHVCHHLPLNNTQLLGYLQGRLAWDESTRAQVQARLEANADLRDMFRNPFMLQRLCQSWESLGQEAMDQMDRSRILAGVLEYIMDTNRARVPQETQLQFRDRPQHDPEDDHLLSGFLDYIERLAWLSAQSASKSPTGKKALDTKTSWSRLEALAQQQAQQRHKAREVELGAMDPAERTRRKRRMVFSEADFVSLRQRQATQLMSQLGLRLRRGRPEINHQSIFEYGLARALMRLVQADSDPISIEDLGALLERIKTATPGALLMAAELLRKQLQFTCNDKGHCHKRALVFHAIGALLHCRQAYAEAMRFSQMALTMAKAAFATRHAVLAQCHHQLGETIYAQGQNIQALEHYREALEIQEQLRGAEHLDTATAHYSLGQALSMRHDERGALEHYRMALRTRKALLGADHPDVADVYNAMGVALPSKSLHYHRKALAIQEKVLGAQHLKTALTHYHIGLALARQGVHEDALEAFQKALATRENLLGTEHTDTADSYASLAADLHRRGQYEKALEVYQKVLAIRRKILGEEHPQTKRALDEIRAVFNSVEALMEVLSEDEQTLEQCQRLSRLQVQIFGSDNLDVCELARELGLAMAVQGKSEQAFEQFRRVLALRETLSAARHVDPVSFWRDIGQTLDKKEKQRQALPYHREAVRVAQKSMGAQHIDAAYSRCSLGLFASTQGDYAEAVEHYFTSLQFFENDSGSHGQNIATLYNEIASVFGKQGRHAQELAYHEKAVTLIEKVLVTGNIETAAFYFDFGRALRRQGKSDQALHYLQKTLAIEEDVHGIDHAETVDSRRAIGKLLFKEGKLRAAQASFRKVLAIEEQSFGVEHKASFDTHRRIGLVLHQQKEHPRALKHLRKALTICEKHYGEYDERSAQLHHEIGLALDEQGEQSQALEHYRDALFIRETVLVDHHIDIGTTCYKLGKALSKLGRYDSALDYFRQALEIEERNHGSDHIGTLNATCEVASVLAMQGQSAEALVLYQDVLRRQETAFGQERYHCIETLGCIGMVLLHRGEYQQAAEQLRKALEISEKHYGSTHPVTARLHADLARSLLEHALAHYRKALEIALASQDLELARKSRDMVQALQVNLNPD